MAIGKITSKSLAADAVTSANLAPGAVTISDIPDSEITADKLHTTLDLSTKTLTLTQASVTAHQGALSITQSQISDLSTTSDLTEGTNLYYTDVRADARAQLKIDALVGSAPGTLDTLQELGDALGDDPNFATTVTNSIATKLPLAGGTLTGNVSFGDNDKAIFGAGSDLQIYSDGANSIIHETDGTGNLIVRASNINLQNSEGTATLAQFIDGGKSSLRYNAAEKLVTTSTGVDITGTITSDGLTVDGTGVVGTFSSSNNNTVLRVKGNGATNGGAIGSTSADDLVLLSGLSEKMRIDSSGNLLVGTTDKNIRDSSTAEGMVYRNGDSLDINRSAAPPLIVNRVGNSDGDIALFRKDGSTVGSIGVDNTDNLTISGNSGHCGLNFSTDDINPYKNGAYTNGTTNLGSNTTRFNDLRLSGEVNLQDGSDSWRGLKGSNLGYGSGSYKVTQVGASSGTNNIALGVDLSGNTSGAFTGYRDIFVSNDAGLYQPNSTNDSYHQLMGWDDNETVFNDSGGNRDFRVESDNNANMLLVDGEKDLLSVGGTGNNQDFAGSLQVIGNTVESSNAQTAYSAKFASSFSGLSDGGGFTTMLGFSCEPGHFSKGAIGWTRTASYDQGRMGFYNRGDSNDTNAQKSDEMMRISASEVIVNPLGDATTDFRVASDTQSNMLYVDGSDNYVGIGTATRTAMAVTTIRTPGTSGAFIPLCLEVGIASNGFGALAFANPNGTQGLITCGVSGVTYNTTSDRRLKDNIQLISDATDKLMDMKPVTHTWIDNPEAPQVHGFIAQEMQEVVPEAVSGDAESDEMMSMDYGRITPVIVAALQDALNEIKELKTRIDELENK